MTEAQKAVQLIFPGFKIGLDDPKQAERLVEMGVGGFCLYAGSVDEIAELTRRWQAKARRPLLFCGDYENGLAQHCAGGTPLPSNMGLGAADSEELAFEKGRLTAVEARAIGVPWVLAPVCDLATFAGNPIVNTRAFSDDPARAARLARAYIRGLKSERALSCLKHFPGHGETRKDSHLDLPQVDVDAATLDRRELSPFRELAAEADSVMTGHLAVPALEPDAKIPYSLSADVARTLRGRLGFQGLVSTDALNMRAVSGRFDELDAVRRALLGGSDVLLVPADPGGLCRALPAALAQDAALSAAVLAAFERLEKARAAAGLADGSARPDLSLVGSRKHGEEAERLARRCLAWVKQVRLPVPGRLRYCELEADRPDEWLGDVFVETLRARGVEVRPYEGACAPDEALAIGCFLAPHAYTGLIEYDAEQRARAGKILASSSQSFVVSFGSPFVFEALRAGGLCAFARDEHAQRAAALALSGGLDVAGRMPVALKA